MLFTIFISFISPQKLLLKFLVHYVKYLNGKIYFVLIISQIRKLYRLKHDDYKTYIFDH
jgi:hypothetical protein